MLVARTEFDKIYGQEGDDILYAYTGSQTMIGRVIPGEGTDLIVFREQAEEFRLLYLVDIEGLDGEDTLRFFSTDGEPADIAARDILEGIL